MPEPAVLEMLDADAPAQEALLKAPPHALHDFAFGHPSCMKAWADAFLPGRNWRGRLRWGRLRSGDRTLAIVPFAKQKLSALAIDSLAGYYWPFRTIYAAPDGAGIATLARQLGRALAAKPPSSVLRFGPVSSRDQLLHGAMRELIERGWQYLANEAGGVFELDLSVGFETLRQGFSSSLVKHIEYSRRRLAKSLGAVHCERIVLDPGSTSLLEILATIESESWVAKSQGDLKFAGAANRRFWTQLAECSDDHVQAVFWVLRCAERPVAFSAHLETPTTVYILANSYDEAWKAHSPGSILTMEVIKDAAARGKGRVDWGQGDSGYKQRWGAREASQLHDVLLFRPNPVGRLSAFAARRVLSSWQFRLETMTPSASS